MLVFLWKDNLKLSANFLLGHNHVVHNESLWVHKETKSMESKLFIALIMIRNSAFFDKNFWNFKTWIHKKYGVKTFYCSHCEKKFSLFWQQFLKFQDMKTKKVWCQNLWLLSLWKEIQPFLTGISEMSTHVETKSIESKLFCSHCDKKFSLFWQEFQKLEDMKTQIVWCQKDSLQHDQA